jgi:hypothetical protein
MRLAGDLFRRKEIIGGSGTEFYFILRRVIDTRLAIGARKLSSGLQVVFRLTKKFPLPIWKGFFYSS